MENIHQWLDSPSAIITIAVIIAAIVFIAIFFKAADRKIRKKGKTGEKATALHALLGILKFAFILVVITIVFQINGINLSSLVAGLGIASAIVGLALQDILKDVIMGFHILADHFYSVGDCVEYNGREGIILSFNLKSTKIGDLDDHSVTTVSNGRISEIKRFGKRLEINVPFPYSVDAKRSDEVMEQIRARVEKLDIVNECTYLGPDAFEASQIPHRLRIFCEPKDRADVRRAAYRAIRLVLQENNIAIPFNQLDVHLDN